MKTLSLLKRATLCLSKPMASLQRFPKWAAPLAASITLATLFTVTLVSFAWSSKAQACRDCPFPMKTSENHWLMPGGQIEVVIFQHQLKRGKIETQIELHSAQTGELLASGSVITAKGQTNVSTQLADPQGNQVKFNVIWYDQNHDRVQIGIRCMSDSCSISAMQ